MINKYENMKWNQRLELASVPAEYKVRAVSYFEKHGHLKTIISQLGGSVPHLGVTPARTPLHAKNCPSCFITGQIIFLRFFMPKEQNLQV